MPHRLDPPDASSGPWLTALERSRPGCRSPHTSVGGLGSVAIYPDTGPLVWQGLAGDTHHKEPTTPGDTSRAGTFSAPHDGTLHLSSRPHTTRKKGKDEVDLVTVKIGKTRRSRMDENNQPPKARPFARLHLRASIPSAPPVPRPGPSLTRRGRRPTLAGQRRGSQTLVGVGGRKGSRKAGSPSRRPYPRPRGGGRPYAIRTGS